MILLHFLFLIVLLVSIFFSLQLILGLKGESKQDARAYNSSCERGRCVILVPAHNEGFGIKATILSAQAEIQLGDIILVVADNCSDDTAGVARASGAHCVERNNKVHVGKGYALQHGIDYIKSLDETFETVVVMDADCLFEKGSLECLLQVSQRSGSVAQALYLMKSPNKENIKLNISEFTWLIKNWVRPLGQKKLGISCHLQGSGMAFPMDVLNKHSLASSSIVEDLELGLNIVSAGEKIDFVESAVVISQFPENVEGLDIQRKRWEHGHLAVVAKMPKKMLTALLDRNFRLFFQALDAAIPPTIIWTILFGFIFCITLIFGVFNQFNWAILYFVSLLTFMLSLMLCWSNYGQQILSRSQLKGMFPFVLGKFGVYRSFVSNREKTWVRTKRDDEQ
jgi:cellulose synthase/poly-beta-1,6-N-acetylglucosamine synthase-like glycosyltransferase